MTLQNILNKLWEEDPGYFRLKQSCKTLLAVFLIGAITVSAPAYVKLFAAMSAGFSMQTVVGNTRKQQIRFILVAFPVYFLCFTLGFFSKHYPLISNSLLVVLGFFALYVKKYGPEFNSGPIIAWIFAFFGIILPTTALNPFVVLSSVLLGMLVSATVYLFLFPELKSKLFYTNINKFFKQYAIALQWLAHQLVHRSELEQFRLEREEYKNYLFRLTVVNGDIVQAAPGKENSYTIRMHQIYVKQYALAKVSSMIMEAFDTLIEQEITFSDTVRSHLFTVFAIYAAAISNLDVKYSHSNYQEILNTLSIMQKNLSDFQTLIFSCIVSRNQPVIPLINLNLGLRLIFYNIRSMEQVYEK